MDKIHGNKREDPLKKLRKIWKKNEKKNDKNEKYIKKYKISRR